MHLYREGAHGVIVRTRSYAPDAPDSKVKNFSRMNFNPGEPEAGDVDKAAWPILTDSRRNVTEGTTYNIFTVTRGVTYTAGDHSVLRGVSRVMVFDLARDLSIPVRKDDFQPYDLYTATSSSSRRRAPAPCR